MFLLAISANIALAFGYSNAPEEAQEICESCK
jgi:hypothetical protein